MGGRGRSARRTRTRDESVLEGFCAFPQEVELLHSAVDLACDDDLDEALLAREPAEDGHP